jgi:hypothetical protein
VRERTGIDGRIGQNLLPSLLKWTGFYQEPLTRALQGSEFARADRQDLSNTFKYLEFCLEQVGPVNGGRYKPGASSLLILHLQ